MSDGKRAYNEDMVAAIVVMHCVLGVEMVGSCMWRLLSSVPSFPYSLGLRFEHATDTYDCTSAAY